MQFINILDFVMVMPLGPDFAKALAIDAAKLGFIGGSYTAAAAVSGLAGSFFLDRFDRRRALAVAMLGLVLGTAAGGFATGLGGLMAARVLAGTFGGPATSIAYSIIADVIPPERRGKAMGAVMGAFSIASVLGVPAGLEVARLGGWSMPFFAVAALGLLVTAGVITFLGPMRRHLDDPARAAEARPSLRELFTRPTVLMSWTMTATVMLGGFLLIPNISAFVQGNLAFPRARLSSLYGVGGVMSFFATRLGGRLVDRWGSFRVGTLGVALLVCVEWLWFVHQPVTIPILAFYVLFMLALGLRNVAYNTLTSKVPAQRERARFLSIQSSVQHAASAAGAFLSAQLLSELPGPSPRALKGMPLVAGLAIALTMLLPIFLRRVERRVTAVGEA